MRRYLAAIVRYKWLVLALAFAGLGGGYVAAKYSKPTYQAQATLWIGNDGLAGRGPIATTELLRPEGWVELGYAFAVLDHVVHQTKLFIEPKNATDARLFREFELHDRFVPGSYRLTVAGNGRSYTLATNTGIELERGQVGEPIGKDIGFDWTPTARQLWAGRVVDFDVRVPREVAVELGKGLSTRLGRDGRFIRISYTGHDPRVVAAVVNTMTERIVSLATDMKRAHLDELTKVLEEQLQRSEANLQQAEAALQGFRVATITLPTEQSGPVAPGLEATTGSALGSFFQLKIEEEQLRRDREAILRLVTQRSDTVPLVDALSLVPSVQSSPEFREAFNDVVRKRAELRRLRQQYTDQYPEVRKLAEELQTLEELAVPQVATRIAENLDLRAGELNSRVSTASGELQAIPVRVIEEARLRRSVDIAAVLYNTLRQRYEDARLASLSTIPDLRILDSARTPQRPTNDQRRRLLMIGLLAGLAAGLGGAVLVDRIDPRFQHPEQVTQQTGLSILGAVPHVTSKAGLPDPTIAATIAEAFREVRLSLVFSHADEGPFRLTLTSPGSGDGKSFISLNLALAFAELGRSTLLIDGDIRRGALHRMLGGSRSPGLTDYLTGSITREQLVQRTEFANLDLIGSGARMQSGPELLGSDRMRDLMRYLSTQYSVIIVDSAPMGAGSDPYTLATLTGNLAIVLRTGRTNREFTEAKLGLLDRLPIRLLGVILNDVPVSRLYSYYPYLAGYEAHDEEPGEEKALVAAG